MKKNSLAVIIGIIMLIGSVVSASAATIKLAWNTPTSGVPAGYLILYGATAATLTNTVVVEPASGCIGGTDPTGAYDCSTSITIPMTDNQVIVFGAKAFNYSVDGNSQVVSDLSNTVSYTYQSSGGQTGVKPTAPRTIRLEP